MNCLICNKILHEKEIANKITYACTSCGFFKTKEKTKESDTYKSEFWEKSDYSEFTGTDFSDKKVTDLKLTFESFGNSHKCKEFSANSLITLINSVYDKELSDILIFSIFR